MALKTSKPFGEQIRSLQRLTNVSKRINFPTTPLVSISYNLRPLSALYVDRVASARGGPASLFGEMQDLFEGGYPKNADLYWARENIFDDGDAAVALLYGRLRKELERAGAKSKKAIKLIDTFENIGASGSWRTAAESIFGDDWFVDCLDGESDFYWGYGQIVAKIIARGLGGKPYHYRKEAEDLCVWSITKALNKRYGSGLVAIPIYNRVEERGQRLPHFKPLNEPFGKQKDRDAVFSLPNIELPNIGEIDAKADDSDEPWERVSEFVADEETRDSLKRLRFFLVGLSKASPDSHMREIENAYLRAQTKARENDVGLGKSFLLALIKDSPTLIDLIKGDFGRWKDLASGALLETVGSHPPSSDDEIERVRYLLKAENL